MKLLSFGIILIVYLLANFYVFHRIWSVMPNKLGLRITLIIVAIILATSFFVAAALGEGMPILITRVLYIVGTTWMFVFLYFVMIFAFQDLVIFLNKIFNLVPVRLATQFSKENWISMLFVIGFVSLLIVGGYLRYTWKERVYLPIQLSKSMKKGEQEKSIRAVLVSDLHLGYTIGRSELELWVDLINKEKPDIVLIAGDVLDNSLRPVLAAKLDEVFRKIEAPMGVYACMGNHEYILNADYNANIEFFEKSNITMLQDSHVEIDSMFYIVGRDDRTNSKRKEISELLVDLDKSKPIILLDHQPYNLHQAEQNGIDLQLSGHTHKGQVWPISMITNWIYEIDHGHLQKGNSHFYVSSGIGIWGGKLRIGTTSEFVVIDINKARE